MHAYTLTPTQNTSVPRSTGNTGFSAGKGIIYQEIVNALENAKEPVTRNWIAKECNRGRSTVRREIEKLVSDGLVQCEIIPRHKQTIRLYSLPTLSDPYQTYKSNCFIIQHCSCGAWRRLKRLPTGNYLRWCHCGIEEIIQRNALISMGFVV